MLTQIISEGLGVGVKVRLWPKPLVSSNWGRGSNPLELPVQVIAGENERGRPAVRAVMLVLGQMPLSQQRVNFPIREPVAKLHGRLAGNHVQQVVEQVAS